MNILARKHYYRQRAKESNAAQADQQITDHLRAAVKALRHGPEVDRLSIPRQIEILESYAEHLEIEIHDFVAQWGADGQDGARHMHTERRSVLESIARLKIGQLRGDNDRPKRPNPASR